MTGQLKRSQKGQSMAGFVVVAGLILVPLMIGMNYLANIGESRHKMMQAARYSSWERTVWHPSDNDYNIKNSEQISREIGVRVFAERLRPFDSQQDGGVTTPDSYQLDPMLYTSYQNVGSKLSVLQPISAVGGTDKDNLVNLQASVSSTSGPLTGIYETVGSAVGVDSEGVHSTRLQMELMKLERLNMSADPMLSSIDSAIQIGPWNSAGPDDVVDRLSNPFAVPSSVLSGDIVRNILDFAGNIFRELSWLEPGKIEPELVPCERVASTSGSLGC